MRNTNRLISIANPDRVRYDTLFAKPASGGAAAPGPEADQPE